jgi:hypothetical protein
MEASVRRHPEASKGIYEWRLKQEMGFRERYVRLVKIGNPFQNSTKTQRMVLHRDIDIVGVNYAIKQEESD